MEIALKALIVIPVVILIIGLLNPKWILFWIKKPDRISVSVIAIIWFMGATTLYSSLYLQPKKRDPQSEMSHDAERSNELDLGKSK